MFETLGLILFAVVIYTFLIVIPTVVEKVSSPEFRKAYFAYLGKKSIHSFGK
jgi:hypothetical protein